MDNCGGWTVLNSCHALWNIKLSKAVTKKLVVQSSNYLLTYSFSSNLLHSPFGQTLVSCGTLKVFSPSAVTSAPTTTFHHLNHGRMAISNQSHHVQVPLQRAINIHSSSPLPLQYVPCHGHDEQWQACSSLDLRPKSDDDEINTHLHLKMQILQICLQITLQQHMELVKMGSLIESMNVKATSIWILKKWADTPQGPLNERQIC